MRLKYTHTQKIEHMYKGYENIFRSMAQQRGGVINPLSTILHHLSATKRDYSVHTELINTSISSLSNWVIYQWSERMCNKEHKATPFHPYFHRFWRSVCYWQIFYVDLYECYLRLHWESKVEQSHCCLPLKNQRNSQILIKLSLIRSRPTTYGSRYLRVRYGKSKIFLTAFCHTVHISSNDFLDRSHCWEP